MPRGCIYKLLIYSCEFHSCSLLCLLYFLRGEFLQPSEGMVIWTPLKMEQQISVIGVVHREATGMLGKSLDKE